MKSLKNEFEIIRMSESTLGTSRWWTTLLVQEKSTGNLYIIETLDYKHKLLFFGYKEIEEENITSTGTTLQGNNFIRNRIKQLKPATEEEVEYLIVYFLDKERIKAKIKENNRQAKLNILL